ncbi:MAG: dihydrodipicolinate synthase family protein [Planctomycetes bacterium]|nr:dihydrodipicolinate synthase family protein [Planctomycetota bacterium]
MTPHTPFVGLVPAALTPFTPSGELNLAAVEKQAEIFVRDRVAGVFVGGTTGEFSSLTVAERDALTVRWAAVLKGTPVRLVVHVGANCLADSRTIAARADELGAAAIAMISPCYLKPKSSDVVIDCCREVAKAAPKTPFYFYDIPVLTGIAFPVADWIESAAERIPTLVGVKFTNPDLMTFQRLIRAGGGRFDVLFGMDEQLLAAVALGGRGAVGSGYNFASPMFHRLLDAANRGDFATARDVQFKAVELVVMMFRVGYFAAAKELMRMRGVELGPVRLPLANFTPEQLAAFRTELDRLGGGPSLWA